jgi:hypothetical protein
MTTPAILPNGKPKAIQVCDGLNFIQTIFKNFFFKILKLLLELRFNDMKSIDSNFKDLENINTNVNTNENVNTNVENT